MSQNNILVLSANGFSQIQSGNDTRGNHQNLSQSMPTRNTVVVLTASPFIPSSSSLCSSYLLSVPSFIAPAEDSERRRRRRQSPSSPRIISIFYDVHCGNCSTMLLRPVEHEALKSCVYLRCIQCTRSARSIMPAQYGSPFKTLPRRRRPRTGGGGVPSLVPSHLPKPFTRRAY